MKQLRSLKNIDLVLASKAKWRSDLLTQNLLYHRCLAHSYSEPIYNCGDMVEFVEQIALKKGISIESDNPESLIISADQLIKIDSLVLGKPRTLEKAKEQLGLLNGRTHQLICAVAVIYQGEKIVASEQAQLKMRKLSKKEISNYLKIDNPIDCAGSYKIEALGASLFEKITVNDLGTIIGIPINLLLNLLRKFGFSNLL
jgi:septum formation protein